MKMIAILNQKGGGGKTTISINLARTLQKKEKRVLLIDADPQGSTSDWHSVNPENDLEMLALQRGSLEKELKKIKQKSEYDYVVIDGAPQIMETCIAALRTVDLVIIPVQPSPLDLWATADLVELIQEQQTITKGLPEARFLMNRVLRHTVLSREAKAALKLSSLNMMDTQITNRQRYASIIGEGKTICETPDVIAQAQFQDLVKEVEMLLEPQVNVVTIEEQVLPI